MARKDRYKEFEKMMTTALLIGTAIFILYLIIAGAGIVWLKVALGILSILISVAGLAFLYLSQELLRQRSLWLSCGFFAILVCTAASLILSFP